MFTMQVEFKDGFVKIISTRQVLQIIIHNYKFKSLEKNVAFGTYHS